MQDLIDFRNPRAADRIMELKQAAPGSAWQDDRGHLHRIVSQSTNEAGQVIAVESVSDGPLPEFNLIG